MMNVTQVSWKKALGVFEARLVDALFEHGAKLREWREIVARAYLDFAAKLPDAEPPTLATWEKDDGRKGPITTASDSVGSKLTTLRDGDGMDGGEGRREDDSPGEREELYGIS